MIIILKKVLKPNLKRKDNLTPMNLNLKESWEIRQNIERKQKIMKQTGQKPEEETDRQINN